MVKSNDFLSEILSYGPSQGTFLLALKKMKEEGRSSEIVQACQKALSLYPDDLRLRRLLAESYLDLGFIGLAEAELAVVTSGIGDLASVYKLQAELYTNQQRTEEAVGALNQYLVHKPDDHDARDLLEKIKPAVEEEKPKAMEPETDFAFAEGEKPEEENIAETPEIVEDAVQPPDEDIKIEPVPESPELSEDVNHSQKEDLLESVVIPEDLAQASEEDIEKPPVPESPDLFEDAVPSQEEDILDSVVIPEDITRALEEDMEEEVVADFHDEPVDLEEKDEFTELATTELAEIYYNQGLISEAIHTYELALQSNPDDKASRDRLAELKALDTGESVQQTGVDDIIRERKKRMITVLEEWMGRIQELSRA
jgi:tetratricopeptide (TPR) repeat protein